MEVVIGDFDSSFLPETLKRLYGAPAEHVRGITSSIKTLGDLHHCERRAELVRALSEGPCRIKSPSERPRCDEIEVNFQMIPLMIQKTALV
jgi:hypothetical protein